MVDTTLLAIVSALLGAILTWFWLKGTRHYLRRGVHTIAIRNLHNGKRLDRWVLTRDEAWTPDGVGPPAWMTRNRIGSISTGDGVRVAHSTISRMLTRMREGGPTS